MSRRLSTFAFVCLLMTGSSLGQQYPFLPVAGAPNNVNVLFQDSLGRLWVGGDQLACFDGSHFFFLRDYGFPTVSSYSIAEDESGAIWIGAETGVFRFSGGHVEQVGQGVAVKVIPVRPDLVVAAVGPLGKGLPENASLVRFQRSGRVWKAETVMSLASPGIMNADRNGVILYLRLDKGWGEIRPEDLIRWKPGAVLPVTLHSGPAPGAGKMKIMRDSQGCVWMGSENYNTYSCDGSSWRSAPFDNASVGLDIEPTPDGSVLLTGYGMLALGHPGSFRVATRANGLPEIVTAIQANDGTIWMGGAHGLYRFPSPFRMEYWTAREGVDNPWAMQRIGDKVYAGLNRSVAVLSGDRTHWQRIASFPNYVVANLLPFGKDGLLAALNPGTAALLTPDGRILARAIPAPGVYGLRLARTPAGDVWWSGVSMGRLTRRGSLLKIENHRLATQPAGNVLDVQYEPHTRKLWACYNGGLAERNDDGSWHEFTVKDGLLVNPCWSLAALPNGDVWYGYYNAPAIALIHPNPNGPPTVRQFRAADGVPDPESLTFDIDQRGWLWRGGNRGLSVADPESAAAGKWLYLDQSDGLPGVGVNSGSYFDDTDDSIWMGMDVNIFHYLPPPDLVTPHFAPQVFVSAFSVESQAPRLVSATGGLPHGSEVVAHIGSLQFDRRNAVRLRYRVLPEQAAWRETRNLDVPLGALSWGSHTLEVQGRVFTGPWSSAVRRSFTVLRPIWLGWPFLSAYVLTAGSLAAGGYLFHRNRRDDAEQVLPDLAAWRLGALLPDVHEVAGTVLDSRFEVGRLLARGGFASVMAGRDRMQQQPCAIKIFRTEVKNKAWVDRSFTQEIAALKKVRNPNVVSIYAHGHTPSGAPYLVMEFVEGRNLRELLDGGALPRLRTARLLQQLAGALDAIHAEGICHRDVKPENVIVRDSGSQEEAVVLIDFSIAIVKDADETLHGLSRAAGTFDYMAPEQAIGYAAPSSDVYSLAKLVLEMLTGRQLRDLLPDASLDLPARVRDLAGSLDLSADSIQMLASALEFDPARRPSVASSFAKPLVEDLQSTGAQRAL
ncbi:MAG TPA: serine/threonine-protein kinase [Bryobacteraceae bacterium]|nr:serine/threonine-protein kinase [Bryobacteraceae bacterium]